MIDIIINHNSYLFRLRDTHILHTMIAFFYVRFETFCFQKRTDLYESSTVDFSKTYRTIPNLSCTEFPHHPKDEIWSFTDIFIVIDKFARMPVFALIQPVISMP